MTTNLPANLYKSDTVLANGAVIRKNECGWSDTVKAYTERPYAVWFKGDMLRTKGGAVRTFGTRAAARKVAEKLDGRSAETTLLDLITGVDGPLLPPVPAGAVGEVSECAGEFLWAVVAGGKTVRSGVAKTEAEARAAADATRGKPLIDILCVG